MALTLGGLTIDTRPAFATSFKTLPGTCSLFTALSTAFSPADELRRAPVRVQILWPPNEEDTAGVYKTSDPWIPSK